MLFKWLKHLSGKKIVLASGSPRRKEILESINLKITVTASTFEENLNPSDYPNISEFVIATANGKASDVAAKLTDAELVIAADTVVVLDGEVMGKPGESKLATEMLKRLSGRTHTVYTGVTLIWPGKPHKLQFCEKTDVTFGVLTEEIINGYVDTNEPFDKAGGYGIQGHGGSLIESINGDFYTVMGLPLHRFCYHVHNYYTKLLKNSE